MPTTISRIFFPVRNTPITYRKIAEGRWIDIFFFSVGNEQDPSENTFYSEYASNLRQQIQIHPPPVGECMNINYFADAYDSYAYHSIPLFPRSDNYHFELSEEEGEHTTSQRHAVFMYYRSLVFELLCCLLSYLSLAAHLYRIYALLAHSNRDFFVFTSMVYSMCASMFPFRTIARGFEMKPYTPP